MEEKYIDIRAINEKIERESAFIDLLTMEMNKVIVAKAHDRKIIDWTSWPRTYLLEGVPISKNISDKHTCTSGTSSSVGYSLHQIYCRQMLWDNDLQH
jgi:hypothetical protein